MTLAEAHWLPAGLEAADRSRLGPPDLARTLAFLESKGSSCLRRLSDERLLAAWSSTIEAFRDRASPERRELDPRLSVAAGLSRPCLDASLESLLEGFGNRECEAVLQRSCSVSATCSPHLVILAANVPGLVLQPLLTALALRRPLLVKPSRREPFFSSAFVAALARREPLVGEGLAVVSWPGGTRMLEDVAFAGADRVLAYGETSTLDDVALRAGEKLIAFGPRASLAVVGAVGHERLDALAASLARDIALFEQRGCLSLQAIYLCAGDGEGDPDLGAAFATALGTALESAAERWPPVEPPAAAAARVRQAREEAAFLGHHLVELELSHGTVVLDPRPGFFPSPGLRTVRIHPVRSLEAVVDILAPLRGRLQGAVLAGHDVSRLEPALARLGVSRFCAPGQLQSAGATWENAGIDLVAALAAPSAVEEAVE